MNNSCYQLRILESTMTVVAEIYPISVFPAWMEDSEPVIKIYNLKANPKYIERFREEAAEMGIPAGMVREA